MAPKGTFSGANPSEVVEFLDAKVLKGGIGRLFRRFDGVVVRPTSAGPPPRTMRHATEAGIAQASISKSGMVGTKAHVHFWPPEGMDEEHAAHQVAGAGPGAPEPRTSFGQYFFDFPADATGSDLVQFAVAGLRALGAQPDGDSWEWLATEPVGD